MSDRLALVNAIEDAGIERGKAENIATAIARFVEGNAATRADVQAADTALEAAIGRAKLGQDGEDFIAAELLRAGIPTERMPPNWPGYDLVTVSTRQRISVKTRTPGRGNLIKYGMRDEFDWLAFVVVQPDGSRSYYITPRDVCDQCSLIYPKVARTNPDVPHWREIGFSTALRVMVPFLGNTGLHREH